MLTATAEYSNVSIKHADKIGGEKMRGIITVIGKDRVGIIAAISNILADANVNILDITQTTLQDIFTMIMLVDLSNPTLTFDQLSRKLDDKGEEMGLSIRIQREDIFNAMHRI
jgi:ACT domain-containing protein